MAMRFAASNVIVSPVQSSSVVVVGHACTAMA